MRLLFVCWPFEDQGSGLVIQGYSKAAEALGHEVTVYGVPYDKIPLSYSLDIASADAIVFVFEWTYLLYYGDQLDLVRLVGGVPRARRVILDGDGNYNEMVRVAEDYNHPNAAASRRWLEVCASLTDKICQPTYHPLRPDVLPFLFYAYSRAWEIPLNSRKEYGLLYVGHSKFRWGAMERVLRAVERVQPRVGRIGLVGHGWGSVPPWAVERGLEHTYYSDPALLHRLGVELLPAVPFGQVIDWMSKGLINPVLSRPTFSRMQLVTPRFFETPAASTIPLFGLDADHVREIYGAAALELVLPAEQPEEKVRDMAERPERYLEIVAAIRRHLARHHSHAARLEELIEIVES
jgi:glycosyltransferase involved in cell wall biosynthesis